ncbi:MAG: VOC family protein [Actinomycetota bacterium]|nr:VOC family protein [Actinomycetota bacterium]
MIEVTRLGHLALASPDVDRLAAYYTGVLGFELAARGDDGAAYLTPELVHHAVTILPAKQRGLDHLAFQIASSLDDAEKELRAAGIASERRSDAEPGIADLLEIQDLDGNRLQLYSEIALRDVLAPSGVRPLKLGHVCYFVNDVQKTTEFYEALGFRWSDWMGDFFVFLRCNSDHHSLNLLRSDHNRRLHHIGYELRDWAHVQLACDALARSDHPLVWGPGRHGPGHNLFTYHHDPDGNVVELFSELDVMLEESLGYFDPRPWHHDFPQYPKVWTPGPLVPNAWGPLPPEGFLD